MIARVYVNGVSVGDAALRSDARGQDGKPARLSPSDVVTVAFFDEHPEPSERPLFLTGRLETA